MTIHLILLLNFSFHSYSRIFGYDVLSSFQFLSRPESQIYMDTLTGALTNPKKLDLDKNSNLIVTAQPQPQPQPQPQHNKKLGETQ